MVEYPCWLRERFDQTSTFKGDFNMAIYKTTKAAYDIDKTKKNEYDMKRFFTVVGKRVFITKYALDCGYIDVQETKQGSSIIEKIGNSFAVTYYNKDESKIGFMFFNTMTEARKNLILKEGF